MFIMSEEKPKTKEDLLQLSKEISDETLRNKTVDLINNLDVSNKEMSYDKSDLEDLPCWIGGHHYYKGGLLDHIYSVTKLCTMIADNFNEVYNEDIDRDFLISAALLHDLAKQFVLEDMENFREYSLDHNTWISAELYSRDFPEKVIEIVMGHGGETLEPNPKSTEAKILHHADSLDAEFKESEVVLGGSFVELE